jgi:nitrite reductase/ring-hydroxylating ferredoxin subunit
VAVYRRTVRASLERVWENVHDWEHLPWLHRSSFRSIEHLESGPWGWRARVGLHPEDVGRSLEIELRVDDDRDRYVTRTLSGAGAGTEIWTSLVPRSEGETDIKVEFHVPDLSPDMVEPMGQGYRKLYEQLWDEDEVMMRRREAELCARRERSRKDPAAQDLGPVDALRSRLPLLVEGRAGRFRIVDVDGTLRAHAAVCPHQLGPLEEVEVVDGVVTCPWHGYRFDVSSGASCDGRRLKLPPAPRVEIGDDSKVRLVWPRSAQTGEESP